MAINQEFPCPSCETVVGIPEWNPYDGVWECPNCGEEMDEIPGSPETADFRYINQNPDI